MKKIFYLLIVSLAFLVVSCSPACGQTTKVGDPKAYLTPEQLVKYEADLKIAELEKKVTTYGNWVGVGGEVGIAVKEGLTAVVDVADKFGKTDVGKFTLLMVAWKVMGVDLVRIVLGFIFLILITWLFVMVYKNTYIPKRILIENPGLFKYPKKYDVLEPEHWEGYQGVKLLLLCMYCISIGITYAIMFA